MNNFKKEFNKTGFFIITKVFELQFIEKIIEEINNAKDAKKYFDRNGKIRRVEKLYDKGENLKILNNKILNSLKNIFGKDFTIFKDKYNPKPPGGEGFFAHYDGIFHFIDADNIKRNGWYEYGDFFINALVALDTCNEKNGTLELSKSHNGKFIELLKNTKNDGTPALIKEIEANISFDLINLDIGDMVVFSNTCPHRSKKNNSNESRRILYYTYSLSKNGSKYDKYFEDKEKSKNKSKALVDKKN